MTTPAPEDPGLLPDRRAEPERSDGWGWHRGGGVTLEGRLWDFGHSEVIQPEVLQTAFDVEGRPSPNFRPRLDSMDDEAKAFAIAASDITTAGASENCGSRSSSAHSTDGAGSSRCRHSAL